MSFLHRPLGQKDPRPSKAAGKAHMARVAELPCVCCGRPGPSEVHHCISGRYSQRRNNDLETIPLCAFHHRTGPLAIHASKRGWEAEYGMDHEYLALVADWLAGEISE